MKAYVLHGINDFCLEDVEIPAIGDNQVLVKVAAAGICGSDIPRIYQTGAHVHPLIPGHEFAGQVVKTGADTDSSWMHKRVGIFPLIPCGTCVPCQRKQYEMCRNYSYLGSRTDGGFAEYVAVPEANLIALPENVSYESAAMLEPMAVAVHAMRRGLDLQCGDTVVVCGLGTIGLLLTMFLKQAGKKNILVVGNKDFQRQQAEKLGIDSEHYCDCRKEDVTAWIRNHTSGNGADLFFECVGKNETIAQAIDATATAGGIVLVGNPYSDIQFDKALYWKILRNQLKVTGTWNSSFTHEETDDWHYVLKCLEDKTVAPEMLISHKFCLEELEKGFHIMRDKTEDYVKIMGIQ